MSGRPRERPTCPTPKQIVFRDSSEDISIAHAVMLIRKSCESPTLKPARVQKLGAAKPRHWKPSTYLPTQPCSGAFFQLIRAQKFDGLLIPKITKLAGPLAPHLWSPYPTEVETAAVTWLCLCPLLHLGDRIQPPIQAGTLLLMLGKLVKVRNI